MVWFELVSHILFIFALGFYLITNLQLYSYKIKRVIWHHSKPFWHFTYFLIPLFAYYIADIYFWIYFYFGLLPVLFLWHKRLDKKLVFTSRVKRFFALLALLTLFQDLLCLASQECMVMGVIMPLFIAYLGSNAIEWMLFTGYKTRAKRKLQERHDKMIVIGITASYGKTSIKNFLYTLLKDDFNVYKTPRSVNTLGGIVKDINEDLPENTQIYIAEMGAREPGDIAQITELIEPHYVIVGRIGPAHIEYFKSLENIRDTKLESIYSPRLKKAFVHASAHIRPTDKVVSFEEDLQVQSSLEGIEFTMGGTRYLAPLLGGFNAQNIALALLVAKELKINGLLDKVAALQSVEHRLQKIEAGGKLIIDDSYNGNIDGMIDSYELVSQYAGRKVLVTPGLVEADPELNKEVAHKAEEIFDLVIVTSDLNYPQFCDIINKDKLIRLRDKTRLQDLLAEKTAPGDLILFSNDAPNFI